MIEEIFKYYTWDERECRFNPVFIARFVNHQDGKEYYSPVQAQQLVEGIEPIIAAWNLVSEPILDDSHKAQMLAKAQKLREESRALTKAAMTEV